MQKPSVIKQGSEALVKILKRQISRLPRGSLIYVTSHTQDFFDKQSHHLKHCAFAYVNHSNLKLNNLHFQEPVWFINVSVNAGHKTIYESDVYLRNSQTFNTPKPKNHAAVTMDEGSFKHFMENRHSCQADPNMVIRVLDENKLEEEFLRLRKNELTIDFIEYAKEFPNVDVIYNEGKQSYELHGNLSIIGPWNYKIPENCVVHGDLILTNLLFTPDFPDDFKVTGHLEVI